MGRLEEKERQRESLEELESVFVSMRILCLAAGGCVGARYQRYGRWGKAAQYTN